MYFQRDPVTFIDWLPTIIVFCLIVILCVISLYTQNTEKNKSSHWRTNIGKPLLGFLYVALVIAVYILLDEYEDVGGFFFLIMLGFLGLMFFWITDAMFFSSVDESRDYNDKIQRKNEYIQRKNLEYEDCKQILFNKYGGECTFDIFIEEIPTLTSYTNPCLQESDLKKRFEKLDELSDKYFYSGEVETYMSDIKKHIYVFENKSIIIIYGNQYHFSDLLSFSLVDNTTSETITTSSGSSSTSTGSMLGRAVVGGVLTGGLGALAGATTAKKNINSNANSSTKIIHDYTIFLNINSLKEPLISINLGSQQEKAQQLASILNVIIERNKKNN